MADLSRRSECPELMDSEVTSFAEFHACLRELERINHLTLAYRPTLRWLTPWLRLNAPLRILDAGCGGGDMLRQIARRAPAGARWELIGVDLNPWAKRSALQSTPAPAEIRVETADIFQFEADQPVDLIICSLFTHHLSDQQLVEFLRWLDRRAQQGWFINDLHRHPVPYYFIKWTTALFSRNRMIRHDAPVSVARAFTAADWRRLLADAGVAGEVRTRWWFPFRICVSKIVVAPG